MPMAARYHPAAAAGAVLAVAGAGGGFLGRSKCACVDLYKPAFLPTLADLLQNDEDAPTRARRKRIHGFLVDEGILPPSYANLATAALEEDAGCNVAERTHAISAAKERHRENRKNRPVKWRQESDATTAFVMLLSETGERCSVELRDEFGARSLTLPSGWFVERRRGRSRDGIEEKLLFCFVHPSGEIDRFENLSSVEAFILSQGTNKATPQLHDDMNEKTPATTKSVVWNRDDLAVFRATFADKCDEADILSGRTRALIMNAESMQEELSRANTAVDAHMRAVKELRADLESTRAAFELAEKARKDAVRMREMCERQINVSVQRATEEAAKSAEAAAETVRLRDEIAMLTRQVAREKELRRRVAHKFDAGLDAERRERESVVAAYEQKLAAERTKSEALSVAVSQLKLHFASLPSKRAVPRDPTTVGVGVGMGGVRAGVHR